MNDLEGHSGSSELPLFDRRYITSYEWSVVIRNPVWHHFRDISTFTVYVTACDLEKSFIFEKIVEITSHVCFLIDV